MLDQPSTSVLIVAGDSELPGTERIWGTGGRLWAESREALDWLTFVRLLGWHVQVAWSSQLAATPRESPIPRCIILGCDPSALGADALRWLANILDSSQVLVVTRAADSQAPLSRFAGTLRTSAFAAGRRIDWRGPGDQRTWFCRTDIELPGLKSNADDLLWATLEGTPIITARRVGLGVVATLGFHPSAARDSAGAATALLRHLLSRATRQPTAWLDLEGTLVLRMDDPGGAQNVYCKAWHYPKLGRKAWDAIGADLKQRNARLSIGYVTGWVDDGEPSRGELFVDGQAADRIAGAIHPSPLVCYRDLAGHSPGMLHDCSAEYRGIQTLRALGLAEVELHGYTHIHPDANAWLAAHDRYLSLAWYRELGKPAEAALARRALHEHPLAQGLAALRQFYGVDPTTLVCPGDEWTNASLERALDLGLTFVSSYYLAIRDGPRFCWATHVCAPYLDEPDSAWFDSGLPVVGSFHDREPALYGPGWISRWLDQWRAAGATRLVDLRELAAAVSCRLELEHCHGILRLHVAREHGVEPVRPIPIFVHLPDKPLPDQLVIIEQNGAVSAKIEHLAGGLGRTWLPVGATRASLWDRHVRT